jgi:hypothetical protein
VPSLLELRQQFKLALATGDFQTAKTVVATINRYELDTAANGAFMRIELNRAFGNPRDIVADPELSNLLTTRVPTSVRNAIVEVFYAIFIAPFIEREDWRGAVDAYARVSASLDR